MEIPTQMPSAPSAVEPPAVRLRDYLAPARDIVLVVGLYCYFLGWVYVYYYFSHFGIDLLSLNIPAYYFIVYSYSVISTGIGWALLALLAGMVFVLRKVRLPGWLSSIVVYAILVALIPAGFYLAHGVGVRRAVYDRRHAMLVTFVFKSGPGLSQLPPDFVEENKKGDLRLLAQTRENYIALYQPGGEDGELPYASLYRIPRNEVALATVEVQNAKAK